MSRLSNLLTGVAVGAGAMYFLDPVQGGRRRALVRDQIVYLAYCGCDAADAKYRHLQNRLYGTFAEMRSSLRHDEPTDSVLSDRVRSAIGRYISNAGAIEVAARHGVVTISGLILASEVDDLLYAVHSVHGVQTIKNHLDVHPTPGTLPALQGTGKRGGQFSD